MLFIELERIFIIKVGILKKFDSHVLLTELHTNFKQTGRKFYQFKIHENKYFLSFNKSQNNSVVISFFDIF